MNIEILAYQNRYREALINLVLPIQQLEFNVPITLAEQPDLQDAGNFFHHFHLGKGGFWLALAKGEVVGSVGLLNIGNGQACLRKMFVHKDFRGKEFGIAQKLLDTLTDFMKEEGLSDVFLGTRADLYAARRFYEKNGFDLIEKENLPVNFPIMGVDSHFYRKRIYNIIVSVRDKINTVIISPERPI
ncbi:MAG: hypothetical protein RI894_1515 [Bacteroidota bacterium]|jgi:GNAT superfamily N-acetyltransferase